MAAVPVTDADWTSDVLEAVETVIVACQARGSTPCLAFAPVLDELSDTAPPHVKVLSLDIDHNPAVVRRYDVSSLPTLLVFRDGNLACRLIGGRPSERLGRELAPFLA